MGFAIVAEFPLGVYRARRGDGSVDALPSPARLHAALLNAAATGSRAAVSGTCLTPSGADRAALVWMETHPPDGLAVPETVMSEGPFVAHRAEGFFGVREGRRVLVTREDRAAAVAVRGPLAWIWDGSPPADIAAALDAVCRDVSHLGTADSPVVLRVGAHPATHRLDPTASIFRGEGIECEVPRPGRTLALEQAYATSVGPKIPSPSGDRVCRNEQENTCRVDRSALARVRYVAIRKTTPAASPWPIVLLLPVDIDIPPERRVAWCVALHRALVSRLGDGAPALVTGKHPLGVRRPANHLAIQYVRATIPGAPLHGTGGAFALLVPREADPADLAALGGALRGFSQLRFGGQVVKLTEEFRYLDGGSFWEPVPPGLVRVWITDPAAIPESRPVRGRPWTIGDAALLSLGLIFRDRFERRRRRAEWYRLLADGVAAAGAAVIEAHKLNAATGQRYVHHIGLEMAVQPYWAALRLGELAGDRTVLALGQTRHLGGGILTPLDLPAQVLDPDAAGDHA